jgi:hypothetical protein
MSRDAFACRGHRRRQRRGQPHPISQTDEQSSPGATDDALAVRRHDYLVKRRSSLHHEGVLLSQGFALFTPRILPAQADVSTIQPASQASLKRPLLHGPG